MGFFTKLLDLIEALIVGFFKLAIVIIITGAVLILLGNNG